MIKIKNIETGEIKTILQLSYDDIKETYIKSGKLTVNPDELTAEVLIELGLEAVKHIEQYEIMEENI